MTALLELLDVTRKHADGTRSKTALDGVTLQVSPGELVAITGRSGSGKSTLLNLAGGLDQPTTGKVLVSGRDLRTCSASELATIRRRVTGYVFQQANLIPTLTALENVAMPLELDGVGHREAMTQARAALDDVLDEAAAADRFPDELSGGEAQRVAIARALVGDRHLLLADEPTGALDDVTAEGILRLLRARCDAGAACVMVTHDPAQAAWADRIIRLQDGRIAGEVPAAPADTDDGTGHRTEVTP